MDNLHSDDSKSSGDTLYFDDGQIAKRFAAAVAAVGNHSDYFVDAEASLFDDRFCHGVAYTGPEVTAYTNTPYSPLGRMASRFTSERG